MTCPVSSRWCAVSASNWLVGPFATNEAAALPQHAPRPTVFSPARQTLPKRRAPFVQKPYLERIAGDPPRVGGSVASVGSMLARARIAAGLSIDDLAYKSKLRATIISAIERDDFSLCGGEVYARGQVRALATIVGLDPGVVMEAYEARAIPGGESA